MVVVELDAVGAGADVVAAGPELVRVVVVSAVDGAAQAAATIADATRR